MGYTNYWTLKGNRGYKKALTDIRKLIGIVIELEPALLANGLGEIGTDPEFKTNVWFNGVEEAGHETFHLPLKCKYKKGDDFNNFSFCKTNEKPYDVIVTACLIILKHHMGKNIEISSDGGDEAFNAGRELVKKLLKLDVE